MDIEKIHLRKLKLELFVRTLRKTIENFLKTMSKQDKHNPINPNATIQLFCGLGMNYRGEAIDSDGLFCFIVVA